MEYELSDHAAKRITERKIDPAWIERTLNVPDRLERDPIDSYASHALKQIVEMDNRVLRVVYNTVTTPARIISVYFDRRLKDKL